MKQKRKFRINYVFCILSALMVLSLVVISSNYIRVIEDNLDKNLKEFLLHATENSAITLDNKIDGYITSLEELAIVASCHEELEEHNKRIIESSVKLEEFRQIGIFYKDGDSYSYDQEIGKIYDNDYSNKEFFKETLEGTVTVSEPVNDKNTQSKVVVISVPIYFEDRIVGVIYGVNDSSEITSFLEFDANQNNAYYHIVDSEGYMLFRSDYADQDIYSPNIFNAEYEYTYNYDKMEKDFKEGNSGIARFKEKGNPEKYVAYYPLKYNNWYVGSITTASVADMDEKYIRVYTIGLMALVAATIIILLITYVSSNNDNRREQYKLAFCDKLTGLNNKAKFIIQLQSMNDIYDSRHYIIIFNIKNFVEYNKLFGYKRGDELIIKISKIFNSYIEDGELVVRAINERFLLLLKADSEEEIDKRLTRIFHEVEAYIKNEKKLVYNIMSKFGVYKIKSIDKNINPETFIDFAVHACAQTGEIYKNSICHFDILKYEETSAIANIESHMNIALEEKEYLLYLQPKYSIVNDQPILCGAESLVRWDFKREGLIFPNSFIPVFENNGFITELDMYMLEQTCIVLRKWLDDGRECIPISVNQSRLNMFNVTYLEKILDIVNKYDIPHHLIEFEITESAIIDNSKLVSEQFSQLRSLGFKTSMDDFGSGFSSLSLLKDIDVDIVKIDKSFFDEDFQSDKGRYIAKFMISLAKEFGYSIVAEGIETEEQIQFLRECKCDIVQGYFFGKPQPIDDFLVNHLEQFNLVVTD